MKKIKYIMALMVMCLASVGYASADNVPESQLEGKWMLKSINNRNVNDVFTNRMPYLIFNFDIEQISGNSGCNSYSGKFKYSGGNFEAPNIASGDMSCPGMSDEAQLIKLLNEKSKLSIMNGELIFSQDNQPVLVFYRATPLTSSDLMGTWKLNSIDGKDVDSDFAAKMPTLQFNFANNKVFGTAGCNDYSADFTLANNVLEIKPMITTRMACDDMDGETKYVKAFTGRVDADMENGMLVLRKDNKEIMTFKK